MKTVEEKAIEYTDNEFAILPKSMAKENMRHRAQKRFQGGLQRGNAWRDPNIEPPDYYKKVIVKYQREDLKIDYACVSRLADDEGNYFFGDYHFDIIIDFQ